MSSFEILLHDFWMSKKIVSDQITYLNELSLSFIGLSNSCNKSNKSHEQPPYVLENFPLPHYVDIINPLVTQFQKMHEKIQEQSLEVESQRKILAELVRPVLKQYEVMKNLLTKQMKSKAQGNGVQLAKDALRKFEDENSKIIENELQSMKQLSKNIATAISQILQFGILNLYEQFEEENKKFKHILLGDEIIEVKENDTIETQQVDQNEYLAVDYLESYSNPIQDIMEQQQQVLTQDYWYDAPNKNPNPVLTESQKLKEAELTEAYFNQMFQ